jgi:hypothetical protein
MQLDRLKNIDDLVEKKEVYLGKEVDKATYDLISRGYIPINLPSPTDMGDRTINNVPILRDEVVMEFSLYDAGNNLLQQKGYGSSRFIKNYSSYLIKSASTTDTKINNGGWLVDVKTLIREAGYKTGYFRVQINFVRNRIGSNNVYDKLYIQEISPTRQEVRLLPFDNYNANSELDLKEKEKLNKKLREEYESFLNQEYPVDEVKDDIDFLKKSLDINTIPFEIERLNPTLAKQIRKEYGVSVNSLVRRIISWFHTRDIDSFIGKSRYYWNKEQILQLMFVNRFRSLLRTGYLPKRDIKEKPLYQTLLQPSLDELGTVTETIERENVFRLPPIERNIITPPLATRTTTTELKFGIYPSVTRIGINNASLVFGTTLPTSTQIVFNDNCPTQGCVITNTEYVQRHLVQLEGLTGDTNYTFRVTIKTKDGQTQTSELVSFVTQPEAVDYGTREQQQEFIIGDSTNITPTIKPYTGEIRPDLFDQVQGSLDDAVNRIIT